MKARCLGHFLPHLLLALGVSPVVRDLSSACAAVAPAAGDLDFSFAVQVFPQDPRFFRINALVVQSDDRIVLGGMFTNFNGSDARSLIRLLPGGTVDPAYARWRSGTSLAPSPSEITSMALLPDGRLAFDGSGFTEFDGASTANGGASLADTLPVRLLPDGTLDPSFARGAPQSNGKPLPNAVRILAALSTGELIVQQDGLRRLTAGGVVDGNWPHVNGDPVIQGTFLSAAAQSTGKTLVFGQMNSSARDPGLDRLYRLRADGLIDATFPRWQPLASGGRYGGGEQPTIRRILVQPDDRILLIGTFTWLADGTNMAQRGSIARLNADGTLDETFASRIGFTDVYAQPGIPQWNATNSRSAFTAALAPDGRIVVGGYFGGYEGIARPNLARLNADGSLDTTFLPPVPLRWITQLGVQADGKVIVSGGNAVEVAGLPPFPGSGGIMRLQGGSLIPIAPVITQQPVDRSIVLPLPDDGVVQFSVQASSPVPPFFLWFHNGAPLVDGTRLTGATGPVLTLRNLRQSDAGRYECQAANAGGRVTSAAAFLFVNNSASPSPDAQNPALTISFPPSANWRTESSALTFHGTAADNVAVARVQMQREGGPFELVSGIGDWSSRVELMPGTNTFRFKAVDLAGNTSALGTRVVVFLLNRGFSLHINGQGNVKRPSLANSLEVGRAYSLQAMPKAGSLFSNWMVGELTYTNPVYAFVMTADLEITANFVPNPFPGLAGTYAGLFFEPAAPAHEHAGAFRFKLAGDGTFSGKLVLAGEPLLLRGRFDLGLHAHVAMARPQGRAATLDLQLLGGDDEVAGTVSIDGQNCLLSGYRPPAKTGPPAQRAPVRYTMVLSASQDSDGRGRGLGEGCATIAQDAMGRVVLKGSLAEATAWASSGPVSSHGQFPVYAIFPREGGSLFGWLNLGTAADDELRGSLLWTRIGVQTNLLAAMGGRYQAPVRGQRAFGWDSGVILRQSGDQLVTNTVTLDAANRFIVGQPNDANLELRLATPTGRIAGRFLIPGSRHAATIQGVILQKTGAAGGFFSGPSSSGIFYCGPLAGFPLFATAIDQDQ